MRITSEVASRVNESFMRNRFPAMDGRLARLYGNVLVSEGDAAIANSDAALERARTILRAHRDRLLKEHAATGVGVGVDDAKQPAIIVYIPPGRPLPPSTVLEGVPLVFRRMAPLKPM